MPDKRKLRIYRGDTWEAYGWRWKDSEGELVPITSARMQFRERVSSINSLLALTQASGLDLSEEGTVYPTLTPAQTTALISGVWDLEVTATSGRVKTLAYGDHIVTGDVARA